MNYIQSRPLSLPEGTIQEDGRPALGQRKTITEGVGMDKPENIGKKWQDMEVYLSLMLSTKKEIDEKMALLEEYSGKYHAAVRYFL